MTSRYVLMITPTLFRLERVGQAGRVLVGEVVRSDDMATDAANLVRLVPWYVKRRSWWLAVGPPILQRRRVVGFPPVTGRQLRAAVHQQTERYFRVIPGGMVADAVWVADEADQRVAFLVAAEVSAVSEIMAAFATHRVRIAKVVPRDAEQMQVDLIPPLERQARRRRALRIIVGAATAVALAIITTVAAIAYQLVRAEARVSTQVATTRPGAEAVRRARSEVESIRRIVSVADSVRGQRGQVVRDLASLTSAMPADVVLRVVALAPDSAMLIGTTESTGHLVDRFSGLGAFDSVRMAPPKPRVGGELQTTGRPFEMTLTRVSP